jgi:hypothetical protein
MAADADTIDTVRHIHDLEHRDDGADKPVPSGQE